MGSRTMSRNSRRLLVQSLLLKLHGELGDDPAGDIYEKLQIGRHLAAITWTEVEADSPRRGPVGDDDGDKPQDDQDAPAGGRLNPCALDILLHIRLGAACCWSDIIDTMADKGYSERTATRWLRWLKANDYVETDGKSSPYRIKSTE